MSLMGQFRASIGGGTLRLAGAQRQGGAHAGSMPGIQSAAEPMKRAPQRLSREDPAALSS